MVLGLAFNKTKRHQEVGSPTELNQRMKTNNPTDIHNSISHPVSSPTDIINSTNNNSSPMDTSKTTETMILTPEELSTAFCATELATLQTGALPIKVWNLWTLNVHSVMAFIQDLAGDGPFYQERDVPLQEDPGVIGRMEWVAE